MKYIFTAYFDDKEPKTFNTMEEVWEYVRGIFNHINEVEKKHGIYKDYGTHLLKRIEKVGENKIAIKFSVVMGGICTYRATRTYGVVEIVE